MSAGPPLPTRGDRLSEFIARAWLFLVSYAPLAAIYGFKAIPHWWTVGVCMGIFLALCTLTWLTLRAQRRRNAHPVRVTDVQGRGSEVSGYLATYLLPFLATTPQTLGEGLAYAVYGLVALVIYVRSDLALVNPTLYLLGYRIYSASDGNRRILVISRGSQGPLLPGSTIRVTDFLDVYVLKEIVAQ